LEYQTKPKRYYALHDGATGKSVIQEVGSTAFTVDVDTAEWLQHHEPVTDYVLPRKASALPGEPPRQRRKRGPNKPKPEAISASNGHQTTPPTPEPVMAGSAAE
jgi:hypothetical protein